MTETKYLIIGGGIAGTTAAETIRHHDPTGSIALITSEKERLYSRVLLPHFLRGTTELERVFLKKESFYTDNHIDFHPSTEITDLDTSAQVATAADGEKFSYEKLLLAVGGKLVPWELDGGQSGIIYLRTIEQAVQLKQALQGAKEAVVVGGGFIALELVSIFIKNRLKVTLLVRESYLFQKFLDEEGGELVASILRKNGVRVELGTQVAAVGGTGQVENINTNTGLHLTCQLLGVGIGIQPNLRFLDKTPIAHDPFIETSDRFEVEGAQNVWAAGDVTFFPSQLIGGRRLNLQNWANAAEQGLLAGISMSGGGEDRTIPLSTTYSINFFDSSMSAIGVTNPSFADQVLQRGSLAMGRLGRIFKKDNRVIGALLLGLPADRAQIMKLMAQDIGTSYDEKIRDLDFSLENIKPNG